MLVIAYLPLLVAIVGLLMFVLLDAAKHPKAVRVGEILLFTGTLAFLLTSGASSIVRLGK